MVRKLGEHGVVIRIHMPQKWILSSSVKRFFRKTRANHILVKQCSVFIAHFDAQCNQKLLFRLLSVIKEKWDPVKNFLPQIRQIPKCT